MAKITHVEEKLGEQNFRFFSQMRGKNLYYNPTKWKIWIEMEWKYKKLDFELGWDRDAMEGEAEQGFDYGTVFKF